MHFQFARWAWNNPENLLEHWAKPVFTLVASPFAQWGFAGMKFLQCLLVFGSGFFAWKIGEKLNFKFAWIAPLMIVGATEVFKSQSSGLTEPMFGFFLIMGVWLLFYDHELLGAFILAALPFVRTEGFLLLPAFGIYLLLVRRNWKATLMLGSVTLIYSLIGAIVLGDFMWIWTKNPYAGGMNNYGIGNWSHFFEKYLLVVGVPIYGLQILGLLSFPIQLIRKKITMPAAFALCILLPFAIYFGAHVYFWATGTGHSMGMERVLIGIVPLGAVIALLGIDMVTGFFPEKFAIGGKILAGLFVVYICIFQFTPNNAAIKISSFETVPDQMLMDEASQWAKKEGYGDRILWSAYPAAAFYMEVNPFDSTRYKQIMNIDHGDVPVGSLIVWDNWFGLTEGGITIGFLEYNAFRFKPLKSWKKVIGTKEYEIRLFEKIAYTKEP